MTTLIPQQLIQLAEFAGWKEVAEECFCGKTHPIFNGPDGKRGRPPAYPDDLDACIRDLVGKMRKLGFLWTAGEVSTGDIFFEFFTASRKMPEFTAEAPTLSLAICLAVIKYLESVQSSRTVAGSGIS